MFGARKAVLFFARVMTAVTRLPNWWVVAAPARRWEMAGRGADCPALMGLSLGLR
jgi:hypothetical protein